jgi:hypothetical protein
MSDPSAVIDGQLGQLVVWCNLSDLEETILLAIDDDPAALLTSELAERGWHLSYDGLMYLVSGTFSNPLNVAAQVATQLGRSLGAVLVHAQAVIAGPSSSGTVLTCCWPASQDTPGACTESTGPSLPSRGSLEPRESPRPAWLADLFRR